MRNRDYRVFSSFCLRSSRKLETTAQHYRISGFRCIAHQTAAVDIRDNNKIKKKGVFFSTSKNSVISALSFFKHVTDNCTSLPIIHTDKVENAERKNIIEVLSVTVAQNRFLTGGFPLARNDFSTRDFFIFSRVRKRSRPRCAVLSLNAPAAHV